MKPIKRILSGLLAAIMVTASASFVSAADAAFTDVSGHWAWDRGYIPYLVQKDVLNGYKENDGTYTFKPDKTVTRAEFIKMLDETFGLTETTDIKNKYNDVPEHEWFYPYFAKAVAQGYIIDYGKNASPNGELSREEAISLLVRYLELPDSEKVSTATFADYNKISVDYREDVLKAAKAELINGYEEDNGTYTFRPQRTLTRAEALTILYRAAGAIFTTNTYSAEKDAFEENAVVKTGGITLSNQKLEGRVIVSEGADIGTVAFYKTDVDGTIYIRGGANIVFDAATASTVVIDSEDIINVTVQAGTVIDHLIVNERTNIMLGAGTTLKKLTTTEDAVFTNISGTGSIIEANIGSADFASAMVPQTFEIAKGLKASFAAVTYEGSSSNQNVFVTTPFVSISNDYYYLNVISAVSGTIRYYFTNSAYIPDREDFDILYKSPSTPYRGSFDVRENTSESKYTFSSNVAREYEYVAIQLLANGRYYNPIIIPNKAASGTGFLTDPYLKNQTTIEFTTETTGTVYYMYSDLGTKMSVNDFIAAYQDQSKALKGEITSRTAAVSVNSTYAQVNRYMVFLFKSNSGLYYTPVVVSLGETGFYLVPEVTTPGIVDFLAGNDGIVYYYYAKTADLPAPDKFNAAWIAAEYSGYELAEAGKEGKIEYRTDVSGTYPYIIACIRTDTSRYLMPVAVKMDYNHGFVVTPEIADGTKISFKVANNGKVYYYYAKTSQIPTVNEFEAAYTKATHKNSFTVSRSYYETISYDTTKASDYPYLVIMLKDNTARSFQPIVLDLKSAANTGFLVEPFVKDSSTISFKTNSNCEVWWFYSKTPDPVMASDFYVRWDLAYYGYTTQAKNNETQSITYNKALLDTYPYIVFATSKSIDSTTFSYPVVLKASEGVQKEEVKQSLQMVGLSGFAISMKAFDNGILYFYQTNEAAIPSKEDFDTKYMTAESRDYIHIGEGITSVSVPYSGLYKYVVMRLESEDALGKKVIYDAIQIDIVKGTASNATNSGNGNSGNTGDNSGTTNINFGFDFKDIDPRQYKVTLLPKHNGTITVTLADEKKTLILGKNVWTARKGEELVVTYPRGSASINGMKLYLFIQFTGADGYKYPEYPGVELLPE